MTVDNTGPYLTYGELLCALATGGSPLVSKIKITLSNKVVDAGGDIYDFVKVTAGDPDPVVGDVIEQLGFGSCIIEFPTPTTVRIELTGAANLIVNGPANNLHSDTIPKHRGNAIIQESMDFIDEFTGQFFNLRAAIVRLEGNNTPTMWLPVPIIEIRELVINSTSNALVEGEDNDFVAFKGRSRPQDDRRNPRIKLNVGSGRDNIFSGALTNRVFVKETLTKIDGDFGFLEENGSTPSLIKRATELLSIIQINSPTAQATSSSTGPLKRLKIDLHEQEFFELKDSTARGSLSGNSEVDRILAKYQAPIRIDGSIEETPVVLNRTSQGVSY